MKLARKGENARRNERGSEERRNKGKNKNKFSFVLFQTDTNEDWITDIVAYEYIIAYYYRSRI